LLAETVAAAGDLQHALGLLDEALAITSTNKTLFCKPELHRLRGELGLAANRETTEALDQVRRAAELAHELGAQALELRAMVSLASAAREPERTVVLQALERLRSGFFEGFETADLISADSLLNLTAAQRAKTSA